MKIKALYWSHSSVPNYARFFIVDSSGCVWELSSEGFSAAALPKDSKPHLPELKELFGRSEVESARTDRGELAIRLTTGHVLLMHGTFDGENVGYNLHVQDPFEAAEWNGEFLEMRQVEIPL